jgi:hypothetical protein
MINRFARGKLPYQEVEGRVIAKEILGEVECPEGGR